VAVGQGPDDVERAERQGRQRALDPARHSRIDLAAPQGAERLTDGDCAGGARVGGGQDRSAHAELDPDVRRRRPAEDGERQGRRDRLDAALEVALVLLLGEGHATERAAEEDPDALRIRMAAVPGSEPGVVDRQPARGHPELAEPVEAAHGSGVHVVGRVEVVHLGRHPGPECPRIEAVHGLDR
jgi:hypothetical protein